MTDYERARTRFGPGSGYISLAHGARGTAKRTDSMHTHVSRYGGHNADQEAAAIAFTGRPGKEPSFFAQCRLIRPLATISS